MTCQRRTPTDKHVRVTQRIQPVRIMFKFLLRIALKHAYHHATFTRYTQLIRISILTWTPDVCTRPTIGTPVGYDQGITSFTSVQLPTLSYNSTRIPLRTASLTQSLVPLLSVIEGWNARTTSTVLSSICLFRRGPANPQYECALRHSLHLQPS